MADLTQITMPARLTELREQVLARSTKRMPKWKFRLAPDIVLMMQPKVAKDQYVWNGHYDGTYKNRHHMSLRFAGEVLMQDGANAKSLSMSKAERRKTGPYTLVNFEVGVDNADGRTYLIWNGWSGKLSAEWDVDAGPSGDDIHRKRRQEFDRLENLLRKIFEDALEDGTFNTINSSMMLSAQCLICGKRLTDPASMARFIGPECAGTTSINVPRTILLDRMKTTSVVACKRQPDGSVTETPMAKEDVRMLIYDNGDGVARSHVIPKAPEPMDEHDEAGA
jgi:hypothetical protein